MVTPHGVTLIETTMVFIAIIISTSKYVLDYCLQHKFRI